MSDRIVNLSVSRRALMKGGALAAAAAASPCLPNLAFAEQIKKLEQEGWTKHPVACTMCGAFCGLVEMRKEGEPVSEKTVRIFPNPGHPQQGYCGRSAATMWVWNHPLRLKKPLKRVGEKGEGKFKEITWDEALDGIAGQLKTIVEKYGESSIASTSHTFSGFSKWITLPLGSLIYLLFCTSRYGWGWKHFTEEANTGKGVKVPKALRFYMAYILPVIILVIFVLGIKSVLFK